MSEIIELIRTELEVGVDIDETTPLVSSGLIDSFGIPVLVTALERHYGIRISSDEIGADNFDTPAQMLDVVRQKQA